MLLYLNKFNLRKKKRLLLKKRRKRKMRVSFLPLNIRNSKFKEMIKHKVEYCQQRGKKRGLKRNL